MLLERCSIILTQDVPRVSKRTRLTCPSHSLRTSSEAGVTVLLGTAHTLLRHGQWGSCTNLLLAAQGSELLFASALAAQLTQCLLCQGSFGDCAPQTVASRGYWSNNGKMEAEVSNLSKGGREFLGLVNLTSLMHQKKKKFLKQQLPNSGQFEGLGKKKKAWTESSSIALSSTKWS